MASFRNNKKGPAPAPLNIQRARSGPGGSTASPFRLDPNERRILALILIVTFAAFLNSLRGQFLFDDLSQINRNPTLHSLANIPRVFAQSVWQFMSEDARQPLGSYYRPVFNAALILNYQLFGRAVEGWHVVSILLHLAATSFVYLLCRQWGMERGVGFAAALLFGVHPAHSESVAWVSALPDLLAAVFLIPALLFYEQYRESSVRSGRSLLLASLGLTLLALLSKEVAIVFPVFLFLRDWLDRPSGEPLARTALKNGKFFYLAVGLSYLVLRHAVLGFVTQDEPRSAGVPDAHVWLTIPSVLAGYARILVFPFPLAVAYDWPDYVASAADPRFWGLGVFVAGVLIGTAWLVRSSAPARNALLFLLLFLLPVLNLRLLNPYRSLLHDRYLYLPSIGFCVLIALGLARMHAIFRRPGLVWVAPVVLAVPWFILTVRQNRFWRDDHAMTEQALRVSPRNVFFLDYHGSHYFFQQTNLAEAERHYRQALELDPTYYESAVNLGDLYRVQNRYTEAEHAYRRAIELRAPIADVHANLGAIYATQSRFPEAEAALSQAIKMEPKHSDARYNLGWVYDRQGKHAHAETAYVHALHLNPANVDARINLGALQSRQGRYDAAIGHMQIALRDAPRNPALLYELAGAYMGSRRFPEAIETLTRLSEVEPRHPRVYTDLGRCYEALGNTDEARRQFQEALEVAPHDPHTEIARERLAKGA